MSEGDGYEPQRGESGSRLLSLGRAAEQRHKYAKYGLCCNCEAFAIRTHVSGADHREVTFCRSWGTWLSPDRPVKDCSAYLKIGQPSLFSMYQLATPISPDDADKREAAKKIVEEKRKIEDIERKGTRYM